MQDNEAGGITQQIGASYFPVEVIKTQTAEINEYMGGKIKYDIPVSGTQGEHALTHSPLAQPLSMYLSQGLLIIDTPGHESFTNLRSRGSGLCDIAILVVDIMHGLEPQTLESIELLKMRKTPFVVALNKIDRLYGWKAHANMPFRKSLELQNDDVKKEFETRSQNTIRLFAEQSLNTCLYYDCKDFRKWITLIPTSAHTGEGIPDMYLRFSPIESLSLRPLFSFYPFSS